MAEDRAKRLSYFADILRLILFFDGPLQLGYIIRIRTFGIASWVK